MQNSNSVLKVSQRIPKKLFKILISCWATAWSSEARPCPNPRSQPRPRPRPRPRTTRPRPRSLAI